MVNDTIFTGSNNNVKIVLYDPTDLTDTSNYPKGAPYKFIELGVTKMDLYLDSEVFSSDDKLLAYDDTGTITIKISDTKSLKHNVPFRASIKVYDPLHPKGQYLVNYRFKGANLTLTVVDPTKG